MIVKQKGFSHTEIIIAIAVVGLVGALGTTFYISATKSNDGQLASVSEEESAPEITESSLGDLKSTEDITKSALEGKTGVGVSDMQVYQKQGKLVYKVSLDDGSEVEIDGKTGEVINRSENESESEDSHKTADALKIDNIISFSDAVAAATASHAGSSIARVHLRGSEDGKLSVYDVRFNDNARVIINAVSGDVVKLKPATGHKQSSHGKKSNDGVKGGGDNESDNNHESTKSSSTSSKKKSTSKHKQSSSKSNDDNDSDSSDDSKDDSQSEDDSSQDDNQDENENEDDESDNSGSGSHHGGDNENEDENDD